MRQLDWHNLRENVDGFRNAVSGPACMQSSISRFITILPRTLFDDDVACVRGRQNQRRRKDATYANRMSAGNTVWRYRPARTVSVAGLPHYCRPCPANQCCQASCILQKDLPLDVLYFVNCVWHK